MDLERFVASIRADNDQEVAAFRDELRLLAQKDFERFLENISDVGDALTTGNGYAKVLGGMSADEKRLVLLGFYALTSNYLLNQIAEPIT